MAWAAARWVPPIRPMARAAQRWVPPTLQMARTAALLVPPMPHWVTDAAIGSNNNTGVTDFFSLSANNAALGVGNIAIGGFAAFIGTPESSSVAVGAGNQATGAQQRIGRGKRGLRLEQHRHRLFERGQCRRQHRDRFALGGRSREHALGGAVGAERQIVNVDDATEDTDAVNLSQLLLWPRPWVAAPVTPAACSRPRPT